MAKGIIIPGRQPTSGIKPSDPDPIEIVIALARRMKQAEQEIGTIRTRLYNMETGLGMLQESIQKLENDDGSCKLHRKEE